MASRFGRYNLVFRHGPLVRVTHWINALCFVVLLMSGLQIFNAHPSLYFGKASSFDQPALSIGARDVEGRSRGFIAVAGHAFDTTGWLGVSRVNGEPTERAFPAWATLPAEQDLATGRRWHFLFAWILVVNGLVYVVAGLLSGRFQRDLIPSPRELASIPEAVAEHAQLRFPRGEAARRYNVLQKLAYLGVILLAFPALILAGWTMSPGLDSLTPGLLDLFGGRQSARTIHFIAAFSLVLFVFVHLAMVLLSGVWNNLRSMLTGWYDIGVEEEGRHA